MQEIVKGGVKFSTWVEFRHLGDERSHKHLIKDVDNRKRQSIEVTVL